MAPKRTLSSDKTNGAKKIKAEWRPIIEALERPETGLTESSRAMLVAGVGGSLGVEIDKRNPAQTAVLNMIGEVLKDVEAKLIAGLEAQKASIATLEANESNAKASLEECETTSAKATEDAEASKLAVGDATKAEANAKLVVAGKQEAECKVAGQRAELQLRKDTVQKAISQDLKNILDREESVEVDADDDFKALLPVLKGLNMDKSLLSTLPMCCSKKAASRGSFEKMAVDELSKTLEARAGEIDKQSAELALAEQEKASETQRAQEELSEAANKLQTLVAEATAAMKAQREAIVKVHAAKALAASSSVEHQSAKEGCESKATDLQNFQGYNMGSFELLRDRTSEQTEKDLNWKKKKSTAAIGSENVEKTEDPVADPAAEPPAADQTVTEAMDVAPQTPTQTQQEDADIQGDSPEASAASASEADEIETGGDDNAMDVEKSEDAKENAESEGADANKSETAGGKEAALDEVSQSPVEMGGA